MLCAYLGADVVEHVHELTTHHHVCPEHGETLDTRRSDGPALPSQDPLYATGPEAEAGHGDVCGIPTGLDQQVQSAVTLAQVWWISSPRPQLRPRTRFLAGQLWRSAPKQSPPA